MKAKLITRNLRRNLTMRHYGAVRFSDRNEQWRFSMFLTATDARIQPLAVYVPTNRFLCGRLFLLEH
jgi:hypothetical protein